MKRPKRSVRPPARSKSSVIQCPEAPEGVGHFYPFRMRGDGTILGYGNCRTCKKEIGK